LIDNFLFTRALRRPAAQCNRAGQLDVKQERRWNGRINAPPPAPGTAAAFKSFVIKTVSVPVD